MQRGGRAARGPRAAASCARCRAVSRRSRRCSCSPAGCGGDDDTRRRRRGPAAARCRRASTFADAAGGRDRRARLHGRARGRHPGEGERPLERPPRRPRLHRELVRGCADVHRDGGRGRRRPGRRVALLGLVGRDDAEGAARLRGGARPRPAARRRRRAGLARLRGARASRRRPRRPGREGAARLAGRGRSRVLDEQLDAWPG